MKLCQLILLSTAVWLAGCDRISTALPPDQQTRDAEAIGFSCRVSKKAPEECIKENEESSPAAILAGWKSADSEIVEQLLDPTMSGKPLKKPEVKPAPKEHSEDEDVADEDTTDEEIIDEEIAADEEVDPAEEDTTDAPEH